MKRIITLTIGIVSTLTSFSQLSFGIQGTGNLSDASIEASDLYAPAKKARTLPGAGLVADMAITPGFTIRSGVNFLQSGITLKTSMTGMPGEINEISTTGKLNLNYLQVPVNILFTTKGAIKFFAGGGPYVSFAVSGKTKSETQYKFSDGSTETDTEEVDAFEKDEDGNTSFKRTDFGVGAIAGVKLPGRLFVNVGYQLSLSNISKDEEATYKNRGLQLTIGYFLWSK